MKVPQSLRNVTKGFVMGASDIVPGVSGGTMALILGIYERLIKAIKSFDVRAWSFVKKGEWKKSVEHVDLRFLVSVAVGMLLAIVILSHPLSWLLEHFPVHLWAFFFGLILASVVLLRKRLSKITPCVLLFALIGIAFAFWFTGLVPGQTEATPLYFFISGTVAICAMMLPGISGSFLLVLLGKYEQVLGAVRSVEIGVLLPLVIGILFGLFAFAKVLSWLLRKYHDPVLALLIGLMIGSLRKIWPWQETTSATEHWLVVVFIVFGAALVFVLHRLSVKKISYEMV